MIRKILLMGFVIVIQSVTACNSDIKPAPQQKTISNDKSADRTYDPCLINANLPVCGNK